MDELILRQHHIAAESVGGGVEQPIDHAMVDGAEVQVAHPHDAINVGHSRQLVLDGEVVEAQVLADLVVVDDALALRAVCNSRKFCSEHSQLK